MKSISLLFILLCISGAVIAQPVLDWSEINDSTIQQRQRLIKTITDHNGNIYALTYVLNESTQILAYDQQGVLIWRITDTLSAYTDMITDNAASLYLCGNTLGSSSRGIVAKLSVADGTPAWRTVSTETSGFSRLILRRGAIFACGLLTMTGQRYQITLDRLDLSGQPVWHLIDSVRPGYNSSAVSLASDGRYLYISGSSISTQNVTTRSGFLTKYSMTGQRLWDDSVHFPNLLVTDMSLDEDSNVYITSRQSIGGTPYLLKKNKSLGLASMAI